MILIIRYDRIIYRIKSKGIINMPQKILGINTEFETLEYPGFSEVSYKSSTAFGM